MKDINFFNETFKILLVMTVCAWLLYIAFVVFVGDTEDCALGAPGWLFNVLPVTTGVLTAPPLIYGLVRLLYWPKSEEGESVWLAGWLVGSGIVVFVVAAILLALALSQYGCR